MSLDDPMATPTRSAGIECTYGPFAGASPVALAGFERQRQRAATGTSWIAFDPASGQAERRFDRADGPGTACDGTPMDEISGARIDTIDRATAGVLASIHAPDEGRDSGQARAEVRLRIGQHRDRKNDPFDPATGAVLRTPESRRVVAWIVTGVDGELWHGTREDGANEIRRVKPLSVAVRERLQMPPGARVSGRESDGADPLHPGGGGVAKVRAVRRTTHGST